MKYFGRKDVLKIDVDDDSCLFDISKDEGIKKLGIEIGSRLYNVTILMNFSVKGIECYQTKRGFHIYILISRDLSPIEIIVSQLALLSDYKRELLYMRFINDESAEWNYLHPSKYVDGNLVSIEEETEMSNLLLKSIVAGFINKATSKSRLTMYSKQVYESHYKGDDI